MFNWIKNLFGGDSKKTTNISVPYTWEETQETTPVDPLKLDGTGFVIPEPTVQEVTEAVTNDTVQPAAEELAQPAECGCADVPAVVETDTTQVVAEAAAVEINAGYRPWAGDYVTQTPVAQEPVAQEPVAQEPVAQEPVAEETVAPVTASEKPKKATKKKSKTVKVAKKVAKKATKGINTMKAARKKK